MINDGLLLLTSFLVGLFLRDIFGFLFKHRKQQSESANDDSVSNRSDLRDSGNFFISPLEFCVASNDEKNILNISLCPLQDTDPKDLA